jgi:hypothetical protein
MDPALSSSSMPLDPSRLAMPRTTVSIGRLIVGALLAVAYVFVAASGSSHELVATLCVLGIPLLGFAAEVDETRTPRVCIPTWFPRVLAAPFVPGQGRGLLFLLAALAAGLGAVLLGRARTAPDEALFGSTAPTQAVGLVLFSSVYGMTTALVARLLFAHRRWRAVAAVFAAWFLGGLASIVLPRTSSLAMALDPMELLAEVKANGQWTDLARRVVIPVAITVGILLVIVLPWIALGVIGLFRTPAHPAGSPSSQAQPRATK